MKASNSKLKSTPKSPEVKRNIRLPAMVKKTLNQVRQNDMPISSDSKLQHRSDFGPTIQKEKADIKYNPGKLTNTFRAFLAPVVAARTTNT